MDFEEENYKMVLPIIDKAMEADGHLSLYLDEARAPILRIERLYREERRGEEWYSMWMGYYRKPGLRFGKECRFIVNRNRETVQCYETYDSLTDRADYEPSDEDLYNWLRNVRWLGYLGEDQRQLANP